MNLALLKNVNKAYKFKSKLSNLTLIKNQVEIPNKWEDFAKLLTIQSGDRFVKYIPYGYQIELDNTFEKNHTTIGVKSRQMGWTTYSASKGLHRALKNPAYTAIYISRTQSDASLIAYTVRQMLLSIPHLGSSVNDNLMIQRIKGGGTLHFRSPGENATRGIPSVSDIFIDEAAFIENIELLYGQIKNTQSMVKNARTLIISTPNTVTDWFYEKLTSDTPEIHDLINLIRKGEHEPTKVINNRKSGWAKFICHWKAHPIYSKIPDYLQKCAEKDMIPLEMVYRERDLSFEDNVQNVFPFKLINERFTLEKEDSIDPDCIYYLGIDTAGAGADYFVCVILKQLSDGTVQMCNIYRNRTNPTAVHIDEVARLISKYEPYRVSIETNSGGQQYYDLLRDLFPSIDINGVNTNGNNKPTMINKLLYLFESEKLWGLSDRTVKQEFLSYQKDGDKFSAPSGKHDDIVIATAIGCYGIRYFN